MPGDIIHIDGTIWESITVLLTYTVGQRKGLKIGGRKGYNNSDTILYVIKIDHEKNQIFVGLKKNLGSKKLN